MAIELKDKDQTIQIVKSKTKALVDFEHLTDSIKDTAEFVIDEYTALAKTGMSPDFIKDKLEAHFKLQEEKSLKIEESLLHQMLIDNDWKMKLGVTQQGYTKTSINGEITKIPHISITADLDTLDEWISQILEKAQSFKLPK